VAAYTLRDALQEACRNAPGEPGIIAVLHTAGSRLNWNPHLHMIATDGCFGVGDAYQVCGFIPYGDLNRCWQRNLLTALVDAEIIPPGFAARVATWYPKGFITHSHTKDHRRDPDVMARLLEYLLRHPVAEARTRYQPAPNTVTLYYQEQRYQRGQVRKIGKREVLTVREFLARLASQIPEPGFQTVRYYGVYANAYQGRALGEQARTGLLHQPARATPRWAEWVWRIHGIDPLKCGRCGGRMHVAGLLLPEDGTLFLRWLRALKDHRPELPRGRDSPWILSQS
jgi:hypothetical protein